MKAKAKFKRPSINGRLVVLLSAFIILILMLASPIRDLVAQRARIAALEIQVQQSQKQVELLREIQAKWNDPNFIAAQARARLHYVMPGEIVFSVIGLDGKPEVITNSPSGSAGLVATTVGLPHEHLLATSITPLGVLPNCKVIASISA